MVLYKLIGSKQGDPLSALLFNALLEKIFREIKPNWTQKRYGIQLGVGDSHRVTNLRFADDVLLVARSKGHLVNMLADVQQAAIKCGLELHPDKTKILTTSTKKSGRPIFNFPPYFSKVADLRFNTFLDTNRAIWRCCRSLRPLRMLPIDS